MFFPKFLQITDLSLEGFEIEQFGKQVDEILNGERNKANNFINTVIEDVLKQSKKGVNTK